MPTLELLDSSRHARLRVRAVAESPSHFAQVFPAEFATAAARCPVLFTKDPQTGNFYAGAMMGFKAGENLLTSSGAGDGFVPLASRRGGFFTSGQQIAIDREHVRFSESEGDRLFDDAGQPADPLRAVQRVLGEIHAGLEQTRAYIAALTASNLIETIDVSLQFDDGERISL